jgi:hypothetical protein
MSDIHSLPLWVDSDDDDAVADYEASLARETVTA